MTEMIVTEDGVRVRADEAERLGLKVDRTVAGPDSSARKRTTTAVGTASAKDDAAGSVITTAAESGADNGDTPLGENVGLGDSDGETVNGPKTGARRAKS
ncbi:hypothetical protein QEH44_gp08 [Arthrobacter phage Shambre1]|uniref:Uncharacterized protein n=1 Tax=Arthrobacter phage Shambre1 TaxID=2927284 RepID=A0A977KNJ6_9CAUD|nr:hypothetical protein QEH44_gp08 [Arthrobacter phage Shambre1]UXE04745.1 hypothetical protein SEA_SHAMBRE1_8 [Arthrobacter phage Shambre1]